MQQDAVYWYLMRSSFFIRCSMLTILVCSIPLTASAASPSFEVSGWIPYWRTATGTMDVLPHLDVLTEVNPFVYTIKSDGTLLDNGSLGAEPWASFIASARTKRVRVIPTIMTSNADLVHALLSNQRSRIAFEDRIAALVKDNNFDGIDIDFEGKRSVDRNYFSSFLKGLAARLGSKRWLVCTIESRTPVSDRYDGMTPPPDATTYANDFKAINASCDRVRIMAYDQQTIDQKLINQAASSSQLYAPISDPAWVEKVVRLAAKDIKKSKIMIGIPTYGYEYDVTAYAGKQYVYDILWTFNPTYAITTAAQYGITPSRNAQGEMFFTYVPVATSSTPVSLGDNSAQLAAVAATTYASTYNAHLNFRMMEWPDAQSIDGKIALAKKLGVRGVSIFKFDGGEDQAMWSVLQQVKK